MLQLRLKHRTGWKVRTFYGIVLLLFTASDGVFIILFPLYLKQIGYSYSQIGSLLASSGLGIAAFKVIVGRHSDFVGRKIYVILSLLLSAVSTAAIGFIRPMALLAAVLLIRGIAKGAFFAVRAPYIRELSAPEDRGKAFGVISAFGSGGGVVSGLLAGLITFRGNHGDMFLILSAFYLCGAGIALLTLPGRTRTAREKNGRNPERPKFRQALRMLFRIPANIRSLCLVNVIEGIATQPLWDIVFPVYLTGPMNLSDSAMGGVYSADNILSIPAQLGGGILSDRFHKKRLSVFVFLILSMLGFFLSKIHYPAFFVAVLLAFEVLFSLSNPVLETVESLSAREDKPGFDLSLVSFCYAVGTLVGDIIVGKIMDLYGASAGFVFVGIAFLLAVFILQVGVSEKEGRKTFPQKDTL
jgi:MFS family permease